MRLTQGNYQKPDVHPPRLFVDLTTSLMLAGEPPIGTSRVEHEIASRLLRSLDPHPVPVVFRNDGKLFALSPEQATRILGASRNYSSREALLHIRAPAGASKQPFSTRLSLRITAGMRYVARASMARLSYSVREHVWAILIHAREIARIVVYRRDKPKPTLGPALREEVLAALRMVVYPRRSDILWTAGLYRHFVPLRTIAEMRAESRFRVVTTCYDLFSITHPQFNPTDADTVLSTADMVALLDSSDIVFAISESTRRELVAFAKRTRRLIPDVEVIQLGGDIETRKTDGSYSGASLPEVLRGRRFALTVGTVERRKNYELLLRAWERLVANPGFPLDLVIVGKAGFGAVDSIRAVESSPLFGSRILWLENCPDNVLVRLYEECHVMLYPSLVEGWGLPVVEALRCGRQVIASNRGSAAEANAGRCRLLDPDDDEAWIGAIAELAAGARVELIFSDLPCWDETSAAVERHLRRLLTKDEAA
jgi:glycosyltransferase involved in cell wall biosynthesis